MEWPPNTSQKWTLTGSHGHDSFQLRPKDVLRHGVESVDTEPAGGPTVLTWE